MSTIVIEIPNLPSRRFEIDLAKESEEFVEEFTRFVTKLEARAVTVKKNGSKRPSPNIKRARQYLDVLSRRPESWAALAEADKIRKDWIRKNGKESG